MIYVVNVWLLSSVSNHFATGPLICRTLKSDCMRKIVLLEHVSVDGFAAGPGGDMSWIYVDEELFEIAGQMTDRSDAALYGRVTFELMEGYWPTAAEQPNASDHDRQHAAWYRKVPKYVLSRTMKSSSKDLIIIDNDAAEQVSRLKDQAGETILMLGSPSAAHPLMEAGLIDEYYFFVNPILVGDGIAVFPRLSSRQHLKLIESRSFNAGVVMLHYETAR